MILIYNEAEGIHIGDTLTIEWYGLEVCENTNYQVVMVRQVDNHCEVEVREV